MSTITQTDSLALLSSSAADTATSPRWRTTESNRGNRFTARPVRSPMLSTEPQSSPASTNSSGNSPGSRLKSKISRSDWSTPSRSHATNRTSSPASARAEGVSLSVARRLLQVVAGSVTTPSVPTLGRATEEAGQRAGQLLEVLDEVAQPRSNRPPPTNFVRAQTGLDARRTRSLCWVGGRTVEARDGPTWAVEFARFSALSGVVRDDGGSGLGKGLKLERARRRAAGQPDLEDSLDIFHTFREGGRALRTTCGSSGRPRAGASRGGPEGVGPGWAVRENRGRATPHGQAACGVRPRGFGIRRWPAERAWKLIRSAFEFFTPEGRFNDRQQAQAVVAAALPQLERSGMGQDPAVVVPPRELHVPGPSAERRLAELGLDPDVLSAFTRTWKAWAPGDCRSHARVAATRLGRWPARSN